MSMAKLEQGDDIVWTQRIHVSPPIHAAVDVVDDPDPGVLARDATFNVEEVGILTPIIGRAMGGLVISPFGERQVVEPSDYMHPERVPDWMAVYPDGPTSPFQSMDDVIDDVRRGLDLQAEQKG